MSFICSFCGKVAPAGTRCTMVQLAKTEIFHPFRGYAKKMKQEDGKVGFVADEGGRGTQTVKEAKACVNCAPSAKVITPKTV